MRASIVGAGCARSAPSRSSLQQQRALMLMTTTTMTTTTTTTTTMPLTLKSSSVAATLNSNSSRLRLGRASRALFKPRASKEGSASTASTVPPPADQRQPPPPPPRVPVEPVRPIKFPSSSSSSSSASFDDIVVLRGECTRRLKVEVEYGLRRGTTDNCYLVKSFNSNGSIDSSSSSSSPLLTLIDVPDESWADTFVPALLEACGGDSGGGKRFPDELVVSHLTPKRLPSLRALLAARAGRNSSENKSPLTIFLSNPALRLFRESIGPAPGDAELLSGVTLRSARAGGGGGGAAAAGGGDKGSGNSAAAAGAGRLRLLPAPTPRWPDLLLVFDADTRVLFTGKLFSAHVSPKVAAAGGSVDGGGQDVSSSSSGNNDDDDDAGDAGGFGAYGADWKHFYECMLSPVNAQATALLGRLDLRAAATGGGVSSSSSSLSSSSSPPHSSSPSGNAFASALLALEDALSELQRSTFGAAQMGSAVGDSSSSSSSSSSADNTNNTNSSSNNNNNNVGLAVAAVAPMHGPVVSSSLPTLLSSYRQWASEAARAASRASVAVFYASAYGNTAALAQAVARGATKAGVGAEAVNLEDATLDDVEAALARCSGFAIGSPTLGGHMPTQVTTALGAILRAPSTARESKPAGAFGSFGWSGEAVDELERKLRDGGFRAAFPAIRVKFRPTAADMQAAEESGTDLAQAVLRKKAEKEREAKKAAASAAAASVAAAAAAASSSIAAPASSPSPSSEASFSSSAAVSLAAELAVGRVVGTLCVVTAGTVPSDEEGGDGDSSSSSSSSSSSATSAMLASWISQASFDPPGLTVAVKRDRAAEPFLVPGARFAVNVLAEGAGARAVSKAMLRPFAPGEDRFGGGWCPPEETRRGDESGAVILPQRYLASWLECEAVDRMEAGDHWVVYASVLAGGLGGGGEGGGEGAGAEAKKGGGGKKGGKNTNDSNNDVLSAVHHRKSGANY